MSEEKKKRKFLRNYIIISALILIGCNLYQEYLYSSGKGGYEMWDIRSVYYFILFSITYFIYWLIMRKR